MCRSQDAHGWRTWAVNSVGVGVVTAVDVEVEVECGLDARLVRLLRNGTGSM